MSLRLNQFSLGLFVGLLVGGSSTFADESDHWAFRAIVPGVPDHAPSDQSAGPIDDFIIRRLNDAGLTPSPMAAPETLIRRLKLVMEGLPPTPEEVHEFTNDASLDAWERLVDRTLASPAYGERWGRHWLDLVRFGETHGFETNRERPNAYHYRDWVIDSLNNDVPYSQFMVKQLAGDSIGDPLGTGFLVAGPYDLVKSPDVNLTLMQRQDELADIINATGTTFLGLTLGCARCHDHKFDPITQRDYYAIQAVFAGVQHGDREVAPLMPKGAKGREPVSSTHNVDHFESTLARFVRFVILETNSAQPCIDELEVFAGDRNVGLAQHGAEATCSGTLPGYAIHQLAHVNDGKYGNAHSWISNESGKGWVQLDLGAPTQIDRVEWARDREGKYRDRLATRYRIEVALEPDQWRVVASSENRRSAMASTKAYVGTLREPGPTYILHRGEPTARRDQVAPATVAFLGDIELTADTPERKRRLAFARWLVREDNPLPARVIVNRLWQFHFGTGIVATSSDFGANGVPPSHPQLLDWLAHELIASEWSLKQLHREILLSRTWKQDSRPTSDGERIDAGCRLWWRFPPRRLEAEPIRDSILSVTGVLDRQMRGPGFSAFQVQQENVRHYFPKQSYGPTDWRRMVYMTKVRQEQDSVFGAFDCPDAAQVVAQRSQSTTPLQALNLFNSTFMMQQAELFAARLTDQAERSPAEQVTLAYQLCFLRSPSPEERSEAVAFVASQGLTMFCRAMLNSNEFLFIP